LLDLSLISGPLWWALMVLGPAVLFVLARGRGRNWWLRAEHTDVNGDSPALSRIRHRERHHDPLRRFMPALVFRCCLVKRGAALRPTVRRRGRSLRMRNGCV